MNSLLATYASSFDIAVPRELPSRMVPVAPAVLRVFDVGALMIAGYLAFAIALPSTERCFDSDYGRDLLTGAFFLPFVMEKTGGYQFGCLHRFGHLIHSAAFGTVVLFGALFAVGLVVDSQNHGVGLILWLLLSIVAMTAGRAGFWIVSQHLAGAGRMLETLAIVGTGAESFRLAAGLASQHEIVGVFGATSTVTDSSFAGSLDDLVRTGRVRQIDKIIVAVPDQFRVGDIIHVLKSLSVDVLLAFPDQYGITRFKRSFDRAVARPAQQPRRSLAA
jgi:FlaA1/EpsC-like NDP-sugar epimerase